MPDTVSVRAASSADSAAIAGLVGEYWAFEKIDGFDEARVRHSLETLLADEALGTAWIAQVGERTVGYLVAVYAFSLEHGGMTAEIDELFLLPGYREAGLGRRLLEAAERAFRDAGCTGVWLEIGSRNTSARRFYERLGFTLREKYRTMGKSLEAPQQQTPPSGF